MAEIKLSKLVTYLNDYLKTDEVPDYPGAHNGLQAEGLPVVKKIVAAVDACRTTIEHAQELDADLLIVHHGLFWNGVQRFVGPVYRRYKTLFDSGISIYSSHLPLDAHPDVGNNHELARGLGLQIEEGFGDYKGFDIGVRCSADLARSELLDRLDSLLGTPSKILACGPLRARHVGIVTGGGGSMVGEAADAGLDTLITGEGAHHNFHTAEEYGVNLIFSGHYATETFGVRALGRHIEKKFGIEWEFVDHPSGL
ncbi:MAG: Nif3-like dinuclear metal center hexameric protein [Planctomycetota bacterium]|nr:Nif3-like dinuclear metal center hexameric protein [Planctomycetota bacterium]